MAKQFYDKKWEYAEIVRENYKPRVSQVSKLEQEKPEEKIHRSLSNVDMRAKGKDYLRAL